MKQARILVVEDDANDRELLCIVLKRLGFPIVETATTMECQRAFDRYRSFHAVFVDLKLGDGDGLHLVRWIKERHAATPVFVITGSTSPEVSVSCYDSGALGVFIKPYTSMHNAAVLNLLEVKSAAYKAGVSKRSWRTSTCAALIAGTVVASYFVHGEVIKTTLNNAAWIITAVGFFVGADMKAILEAIAQKKNGNGSGH